MSDNTSIPDDIGTHIEQKDVICVAGAQTTDLTVDTGSATVPLISMMFGGADLFQAVAALDDGADPRLVFASHDTTHLLMAPSGVMATASTLLALLASLNDPRFRSFLVEMHEMLGEALG